jgi:hypothetical protein
MTTFAANQRTARENLRQKDAPPPKPADFKFLSAVNCRWEDRAAVSLLTEYADSAARFFNDRKRRYAVECLASSRLFAEYAVIYIANREGIELPTDTEDDRVSFYAKVKSLRDALRAHFG